MTIKLTYNAEITWNPELPTLLIAKAINTDQAFDITVHDLYPNDKYRTCVVIAVRIGPGNDNVWRLGESFDMYDAAYDAAEMYVQFIKGIYPHLNVRLKAKAPVKTERVFRLVGYKIELPKKKGKKSPTPASNTGNNKEHR